MVTSITTLALSLMLSGSAIWLGPKPPQEVKRIVSLAPSMTEVLFALELGEHVVGVTRYATWPEAVKKVPKVGGFIDPDLESIVALKPDLVLAIPTSGGADRIRQMAGLGLSVLVLPAKTLDELWSAITFLGELLHKDLQAKNLTTSMKKDLAALRSQASRRPPKRALVALGHKPLVVAGPGSFVDSLLGAISLVNVIERGGTFPHIDLEALVRFKPDLILDMTLKSEAASHAFWKSVPILNIQDGKNVIVLHNDALLRPGPRLINGLKELLAILWRDS
jgi:iron complex transport system substrate-binding protein